MFIISKKLLALFSLFILGFCSLIVLKFLSGEGGKRTEVALTASPVVSENQALNTVTQIATNITVTANNIADPYLILVNRKHPLSSKYVPKNLVLPKVASTNGNKNYSQYMEKTAAAALEQLFAAAKKDKINLKIRSGYRSYAVQKYLYNISVKEVGKVYADKYHAKAGNSEHQTGLAADVLSSEYSSLKEAYAKTRSYKWVLKNCAKYGFIVRYAKGKESITGYNFEPWHIRYVGQAVASEIMSSGITFEEYLNQK